MPAPAADNTANTPLIRLLSLPSIVASIDYLLAGTLEHTAFANSGVFGITALATLVLQPLFSFILVCWAIARWANRESVPAALIAGAIANAIVFGLLHQGMRFQVARELAVVLPNRSRRLAYCSSRSWSDAFSAREFAGWPPIDS